MTLPNFLIVGVMKSGTTSMYAILEQHSCIEMSSTKEVTFFNHDDNFEKGPKYYESFFCSYPETLVMGEATPHYLPDPKVPE